jgi:hypothetical protein
MDVSQGQEFTKFCRAGARVMKGEEQEGNDGSDGKIDNEILKSAVRIGRCADAMEVSQGQVVGNGLPC